MMERIPTLGQVLLHVLPPGSAALMTASSQLDAPEDAELFSEAPPPGLIPLFPGRRDGAL